MRSSPKGTSREGRQFHGSRYAQEVRTMRALLATLATVALVAGGGGCGGNDSSPVDGQVAPPPAPAPEQGPAVDEIEVGHLPTAVTVAGGSVWVANTQDDTVTRIDPISLTAVGEPIPVAKEPVSL